jgi:hypothetical protein
MDMGKVTRHTGLSFARIRFLLMVSASMTARTAAMINHFSIMHVPKLFIAIVIGLGDPNIFIDLALTITTRGQVVTRQCRDAGCARSPITHLESLHLAPGYAVEGVQGGLPPNKLWTSEGGAIVTTSTPVMRHNRTRRVWMV